jgi:hypothetical protein
MPSVDMRRAAPLEDNPCCGLFPRSWRDCAGRELPHPVRMRTAQAPVFPVIVVRGRYCRSGPSKGRAASIIPCSCEQVRRVRKSIPCRCPRQCLGRRKPVPVAGTVGSCASIGRHPLRCLRSEPCFSFVRCAPGASLALKSMANAMKLRVHRASFFLHLRGPPNSRLPAGSGANPTKAFDGGLGKRRAQSRGANARPALVRVMGFRRWQMSVTPQVQVRTVQAARLIALPKPLRCLKL